MIRLTIVLSLALLATGSSTAWAADVDRCGTITEAGIGDLVSGGYISIDRDKYIVGTVDPTRSVTLPPAALVKAGARVCFKGNVVETAPREFDVWSGTFTMQSATLPSTATEGGRRGMLLVGLASLLGGALVLRRRPISSQGAQ
jgi:LPXTG-motif cell wall-anchored protein